MFQENAALCDQVFQLQEKIIGLKEERNYLLKRSFCFDSSRPGQEPNFSSLVSKVPTPTNLSKPGSTKKRDGAWEKVKGRKTLPAGVKRKTIVPVPVDSSGLPVFPVNLGSLSVHSLGEIITDRSSFHDEDLIYPVGFCSTRIYGSLTDPSTPCIYTCMILDGGAAPL